MSFECGFIQSEFGNPLIHEYIWRILLYNIPILADRMVWEIFFFLFSNVNKLMYGLDLIIIVIVTDIICNEIQWFFTVSIFYSVIQRWHIFRNVIWLLFIVLNKYVCKLTKNLNAISVKQTLFEKSQGSPSYFPGRIPLRIPNVFAIRLALAITRELIMQYS